MSLILLVRLLSLKLKSEEDNMIKVIRPIPVPRPRPRPVPVPPRPLPRPTFAI